MAPQQVCRPVFNTHMQKLFSPNKTLFECTGSGGFPEKPPTVIFPGEWSTIPHFLSVYPIVKPPVDRSHRPAITAYRLNRSFHEMCSRSRSISDKPHVSISPALIRPRATVSFVYFASQANSHIPGIAAVWRGIVRLMTDYRMMDVSAMCTYVYISFCNAWRIRSKWEGNNQDKYERPYKPRIPSECRIPTVLFIVVLTWNGIAESTQVSSVP